MSDDVLVTTLGDLGRGFGKRLRKLSRAGVPGLMVAGPAGMLAQRHLQKRGGARRLLRGGGAGLLMAGPAGFLAQRQLDRRGASDLQVLVAGMGDLGRFRFKKILKPVSGLMRPAMSLVGKTGMMGKGGGMLAAMGPWGWAAAGALAAGGATAAILARRRQKKKAQRRARAAEAASAAPAQAEMMPMPVYAPPMEVMPPQEMYAAPYPSYTPPSAMPSAYPGEAMTVDAGPMPVDDGSTSDVIVAGTPPPPAPQPMVMESPVIEAEPMPDDGGDAPVMAGLGAAPAGAAGLLTLAALGIGAWWLLHAQARHRPRGGHV